MSNPNAMSNPYTMSDPNIMSNPDSMSNPNAMFIPDSMLTPDSSSTPNSGSQPSPVSNLNVDYKQRGIWYYQDPEDAGHQTTSYSQVKRQADDYVPWQSVIYPSGKYGYQGRSDYPKWSKRLGYDDRVWKQRRPSKAPKYQTMPLGVKGLTDRADYDWSWYWNHYSHRHGRWCYLPPDEKRGGGSSFGRDGEA